MGNIADRRAKIKREREIAEKPGSVEDVSFAKLNKNLCNYPLARDQKGSSGWSATPVQCARPPRRSRHRIRRQHGQDRAALCADA
jgi:hypothetical protein